MTVNDFELRGRKAILEFLGVRSWITAKRRLKRLGLFAREGGQPVLNIEAYRIRSLQIHLKDPK